MRRVMTVCRAHPVLSSGVVMVALLGCLSAQFADRQIVVNTSPSVPPGLYMRSKMGPAVGRLVDFRVPVVARPYVFQRSGRDGGEWYIIKPIVAGPGDTVDTTEAWLLINGRQVAPMPPHVDSLGRPLPSWRSHKVLGPGEFFVYSSRVPNSFDSRCYGPITISEIEAVREPLLTW